MDFIFLTLVGFTAFVVLVALALVYLGTRDTFHPLALATPMLIAMYVFLPLWLLYSGKLTDFLSSDELQFVQLLNFLGVACFSLGCLIATWKKGPPADSSASLSGRGWIFVPALVLGAIGVACYSIQIARAGGFREAYGHPYGGGWSEYGYVRDGVLLCVAAIVFIMLGNGKRKLSPLERLACLLFAAPSLIQGVLGARRGPLLMVLSAWALSWFFKHGRRPRLPTLYLTGLGLGILLLFLVSNRGSIYLGSDWTFEQSPFAYLEPGSKGGAGSEYVYGAGAILTASETHHFYWGHRYFAILFVRPIPRQLWPNKYEAVGVPELELNMGAGTEEFRSVLGWVGAHGSAPGFIADMWIEFWWFCLLPIFALGWVYGRAWRAACRKQGLFQVVYVLMTCLLPYLIFQNLEAMLQKFLFMIIPSWLMWQLSEVARGVVDLGRPAKIELQHNPR